MTVLVGRMPGADPGGGPVVLGARLARALGGPLVVCTVTAPGHEPPADPGPDPAVVEGVDVELAHVADRSVPGGLARAAHAHGAAVVVLGDGPPGPGSVGGRLARAADVPVALADATTVGEGPLTRVTCAFDGGRGAPGVLATAVELARRAGASLRVASFAPQRGPTVPPEAGLRAEHIVVEQWREQLLSAQRTALSELGITDTETLAVADTTVDEAVRGIGWDQGDLLVLGAAAAGATTRVLLGDPAAAVLRAAPVPVVLSPGANIL